MLSPGNRAPFHNSWNDIDTNNSSAYDIQVHDEKQEHVSGDIVNVANTFNLKSDNCLKTRDDQKSVSFHSERSSKHKSYRKDTEPMDNKTRECLKRSDYSNIIQAR